MTLPSSYTISGDLVRVGDRPVAFGGSADVWGGIHGGRKVCVKVLRFYLNGDQALTKVRIDIGVVSLVSTEEHLSAS